MDPKCNGLSAHMEIRTRVANANTKLKKRIGRNGKRQAIYTGRHVI
jgi:hypothetical protein